MQGNASASLLLYKKETIYDPEIRRGRRFPWYHLPTVTQSDIKRLQRVIRSQHLVVVSVGRFWFDIWSPQVHFSLWCLDWEIGNSSNEKSWRARRSIVVPPTCADANMDLTPYLEQPGGGGEPWGRKRASWWKVSVAMWTRGQNTRIFWVEEWALLHL